jgi:hypothetical protein
MTPPTWQRASLNSSNRIDLAIKACYFPRKMAGERKRLFLGVGDEVTHKTYNQWGLGVVVEVMTSVVPGGTCLVRIRFQDGQLRTFNNDLDSEGCCYYFGVRRYWNPQPRRVAVARSKHLLP